jgi:Flp pilus assembly protein TadG
MRRLGAKISQFKRMLKDESGNMAIIVSLLALPMMMAGGAAVDYGNWVSVQARLQAATDAAALAAGREANLSDAELTRVATDYFTANFGNPRNAGTPQLTLTIHEDDGKLRVDSQVTVENYLMKVAGQVEQTITASSEVSKEATGLEVALVFDNTGSMSSQSRLSTLKIAAKDFVEILFGPRTEADTLKVAVVPFSQFVNVGPDKAGALWLDTNGLSDYSKANFTGPGPEHNWAAWQAITARRSNRTWTGCVEARRGALATNDAPPDTNDPDTLFVPAFAPDEPGKASENRACRNSNGDRSNCGNSVSYIYNNNYLSDSTDNAPNNVSGGRNRVDYQQRHARKYQRERINTNARGPEKGCNIQPIQALTNQKAPVLSTINNMRADGYTHVAEGAAWGLRVLSPGEPFSEGVPYSDRDITKAMVLLTDGENTFQTESNHNRSTYTAYGYLDQARLGSTNYVTAVNTQNQMLQTTCNNIKAQDIVVYSFAYNVPNATQRNLIKNCASSPEKYFDPPSNAALVRSFQQIADELRRLHLSQ